ncbi:MAG: hypothetical protein KC457_29120, partial [Myxococcales bacterium]|nr:hypothetical protein [Myxococcales bacterium]
MTAIARTVYRARKQATEWWGLIVVAGFAYLLAMGLFSAKRLWAGDLLVRLVDADARGSLMSARASRTSSEKRLADLERQLQDARAL